MTAPTLETRGAWFRMLDDATEGRATIAQDGQDSGPGLQNALAPKVQKRRSQKQGVLEGLRAEVRRALAGLGDARERVLERFRLAGGDLPRWTADDARLMAAAMTAEEDAMELRGSRYDAARATLRAARRQVEAVVFP